MRNVFDAVMPDVVTIRTSAGSVHENVRALVESAKGRIFTSRSDIPITPGDKIIRRTPAGVEEVFTVVDPGLHAGLSGIPATYQMTVRRDDSPLKPTRSGTVIYNVTGTGARFNIDSVDNSTNVINQAPAEMFQALRDAIKSNVGGADGEQLLIRATELEAEAGKAGFGQKYAAFMELAAHHVDALAPFMPALTQLLIGGVKHLVG